MSAQVVGRRNYRFFIAYVNSVSSLAAFVCLSCGWVVYTVAHASDPCADRAANVNETELGHRADSLPEPDTYHGQDDAHGGAAPWCHDDFLSKLVEV